MSIRFPHHTSYIFAIVAGAAFFVLPTQAYAAITPSTLIAVHNNDNAAFEAATTTSSFTPSSNSLLVVILSSQYSSINPSTISISGGGLTYTSRVLATQNVGSTVFVQMWTAPVIAGKPMTITLSSDDVDAPALRRSSIVVLQFTDDAGTIPTPVGPTATLAIGGVSHDGALTVPLGATTKAGDYVVSASIADNVGGVLGDLTPGSGWTEAYEAVAANDWVYGVQYTSLATSSINYIRLRSDEFSYAVGGMVIGTRNVLTKPPNNLGLVGYWSFNEGGDTTAGDFSGNGNTATLDDFPTPVPGKRGKALSLNGTDEFVSLTNSSLLNPSSAITVAFWMKGTDMSGVVAGRYDGTFAGSSWLVWSDGANAIRWYTANGVDEAGTDTLVSNGSPYDGAWHHVVVTWQSGSNNKKIYIDGVLDNTGTHSVSLSSNSTDTRIGTDSAGDTLGVWGNAIDEVRIYNRALGASEVAALARSGAARVGASSADLDDGSSLESGLVGHWTMDGRDTQSTIADISGSGNHGYFFGGATSSAKTIGKLGQALVFESADEEYVSIPASSAALDLETSLSISAWVKSTAENGDRGIFARGHGFGDRWYFYLENGALVLGSSNGGNFTFAVENNATTHVGEWAHLVGTMDSTLSGSERIKLYRNGVELTDKTFQWTSGFDSTSDFTDIGAAFAGNSSFFLDGSIDDLRIYNRALSPAEVKQLYNLGVVKIRQ